MAAAITKPGLRLGMLVAVKRHEGAGLRKSHWSWLCDCDRTAIRTLASIKKSMKLGFTPSCGCAIKPASRRIDRVGQRYGNLTVERLDERSNRLVTRWWCRCDCGKERSVFGSNLTQGLTVSCGCIHRGPRIVMAKQKYLKARSILEDLVDLPMNSEWTAAMGRAREYLETTREDERKK